MGYDLHITRARRWSDPKPAISEAEWRAYVTGDPEMERTGESETIWSGHPDGIEVRFDHRDGHVAVKNPDAATIAKMIAVARALDARVQGDDGETYEAPDRAPRPATLSLGERLGAWVRRLKPRRPLEPKPIPFAPGDRVRDILGKVGTVSAVDPKANHGLGSIRVSFDDGRQIHYAGIAHDLTRV